MLALMGVRVLANDRRRRRDGGGDLFVDRRHPERGLKSAGAHDRHAIETDEMRGPDEHDGVERAIAQKTVGVRRDRPRVHQPGVRRHERHHVAAHVTRGVRQMAIDGSRERVGGARIPRARHRRTTYGWHHTPL